MQAASDRPHLVVRHKNLLTIATMCAVVMQVLDSTIANVALPYMEASLGATHESITWVLTSYIVAGAMAIPLSGWLAARFGTRRVFLISIAMFVAASIFCGVARTLPLMVAARLVQGVGGAFLSPLTQTILLDINRASDRGKAMAYFGMGVTIGPILGPIIGGWLTENLNWRWVFFINLPIGMIAFAGLWVLLPRAEEERRPIDLMGWGLIATALAALQLFLDRGEHVDWFNSAESWIEVGIAASAFWMFAVHTASARQPIFPMGILRDRNLVVASVVVFVLNTIQMASMALLPSMFQTLFGYPVLTTGLVLASRGIGVMFSMWFIGRIITRVDPRIVVMGGMLLLDLSLWQMTGWSLDLDWPPVVINGIIQGFGVGSSWIGMSIMAFTTVSPANRADAAGFYTLTRNVGGSVGIAIATVAFARNSQISHSDLAAHVTPYNLPLDPSLLTAAGNAGEAAMEMVNGIVTRQAAMIAYLDDFHVMFIAGLASLPLLFILRPPKGTPLEGPLVSAD